MFQVSYPPTSLLVAATKTLIVDITMILPRTLASFPGHVVTFFPSAWERTRLQGHCLVARSPASGVYTPSGRGISGLPHWPLFAALLMSLDALCFQDFSLELACKGFSSCSKLNAMDHTVSSCTASSESADTAIRSALPVSNQNLRRIIVVTYRSFAVLVTQN